MVKKILYRILPAWRAFVTAAPVAVLWVGLGALPALGENEAEAPVHLRIFDPEGRLHEFDLVDRYELQAFIHTNADVRLEGQKALAMAIARDPERYQPEIRKLMEMLETQPSDPAGSQLRYDITKVFYWMLMLMHIHDTEAAGPIVRYLEQLARREAKEGNTFLVQGLMSAAMEGKKRESPPGSEELGRESESRLLHALKCSAEMRAIAP